MPTSSAACWRRRSNPGRILRWRKRRIYQFQGYFFRHTEHPRARHIPATDDLPPTAAGYLKVRNGLCEIEDLVKREPSLCYRLLRYLNSPLLGVSAPVLSIRHALNLLGERELARWIRMASAMAWGGQVFRSDSVIAGAGSLLRADRSEGRARKSSCTSWACFP